MKLVERFMFDLRVVISFGQGHPRQWKSSGLRAIVPATSYVDTHTTKNALRVQKKRTHPHIRGIINRNILKQLPITHIADTPSSMHKPERQRRAPSKEEKGNIANSDQSGGSKIGALISVGICE